MENKIEPKNKQIKHTKPKHTKPKQIIPYITVRRNVYVDLD